MMMPSGLIKSPYQIIKIKKQNNLYELVLANNDTYLCNEDDIFEYKLYPNRILDSELEILESKNEYYRCLNQALSIINYKQYTIKQVRDRLIKNGYSSDVIDEVINYFIKLNILNDDDYYDSYVRSKQAQGYGPLYIKNKLNGLGINKEVIFDYDIQYELITKHLLKNKNIKDTKKVFERKFINKMIMQGFNDSIIKEVLLNNHLEYQNINLKKDYQKIKHLDKYQIKQKLFKKGYTNDEITNVMEEDIYED